MKLRSVFVAVCVTVSAAVLGVAAYNYSATGFAGKRVSSLCTPAQMAKKSGLNAEAAKMEAKNIRDAMLWQATLRASNPADTSLDPKYVLQAREQIMSLRRSRALGPLNLNWQELGPDNVGGRTRAILVDKDNSNLVYAGGVTGGLWISHDGALTWQKSAQNDILGDHSISSIVQANNGDLYYGTGESFVYTEQNDYGHLGGGIYKSTDGGNTWNLIPSTALSPADGATEQWSYVNELAIRYDNSPQGYALYAATQKGLVVSFDGGDTWNQINGLANGDINGPCQDVKVCTNGMVHAGINNHYYRADDSINFTNSGITGFPTTNVSFITFGTTAQDPEYIYALCANNGTPGCVGQFCGAATNGVYRSTDGGFTWNPYSPINSTAFNPLGGQGDYDIILAVSPSNKNRVYVGGQLEMWAGGNDIGWSQIATAGGGETYPYYIHADMHAIAFDPKDSNIMYVGSDGGINKSLDAQDAQPTFTTRNQGYFVTQFYGMDAGTDGKVMAGAQDNGTSYIDYNQNTSQNAVLVWGSDGGPTAISKFNNQYLFCTDQFGLYRSSNQGAAFGDFPDDWLTALMLNYPFERPYSLWESADTLILDQNGDTISHLSHYAQPTISILMVGAGGKVVFTRDATNFNVSPTWYGFNIGTAYCYAVASASDGRFYAGTSDGHIYTIANLQDTTITHYNPSSNSFTGNSAHNLGTLPFAGRLIAGIAVDPHNSGHIVVCLGGYGYASNIYESFNADSAAPVFTNIQGTLPNMPVYSAVIDFYNPNNVIAGTDMGIWTRTDTTNNWGEDNTGLISIPIYGMKQTYMYDTTCQIVYASSYGQGMFRTTTLTLANNATCDTLLTAGIKNLTQAATVNSINVYPNPASTKSIVDLSITQPTDVKIVVTDILGRTFFTKDYGQLTGKQDLPLDVSSLSPGNYFVSVQTGNKTSTKPIVVVR